MKGGCVHSCACFISRTTEQILMTFGVLTLVKVSVLYFWVVMLKTSASKMETVCFSETLVSTYESTQYHDPEQHRQMLLKFVTGVYSKSYVNLIFVHICSI
jgi:hypothetical protein